MSTSSPATRNCGSKPPISSSALAPESHVAAGKVLRLAIGEQHVDRAARRLRDAARHGALVRGRQVGSRRRRRSRRVLHRGHQMAQPVRVGMCVVVEVGDDLAVRGTQRGVTRAGEPLVLGPDQPARDGVRRSRPWRRWTRRPRRSPRSRDSRVARPRRGSVPGCALRCTCRPPPIPSASDAPAGERRARVRIPHRRERGLRPPIAIGEPEVPVEQLHAVVAFARLRTGTRRATRPSTRRRTRPRSRCRARCGSASRAPRPAAAARGRGCRARARPSERPVAAEVLEAGEIARPAGPASRGTR